MPTQGPAPNSYHGIRGSVHPPAGTLLLHGLPRGLAHRVVVELEPDLAARVEDVCPVVALVGVALVHHDGVQRVGVLLQAGVLVHPADLLLDILKGNVNFRMLAYCEDLPEAK